MNEWDEKYLLNINVIDEQHRGFFDLVKNELSRNNKPGEKQLVEVINHLEDYIKEHFYTEERLLIKSGYNDIENHKAQHAFFIEKVDKMKLEIDYNNPLLYNKLIDFMKKWFLSHIVHSDRKFKETVSNYLQNERT